MVSRCHVKPTEINKNNRLPIWVFDEEDSLTKGPVSGSSLITDPDYNRQKFISIHSAEPPRWERRRGDALKSVEREEQRRETSPHTLPFARPGTCLCECLACPGVFGEGRLKNSFMDTCRGSEWPDCFMTWLTENAMPQDVLWWRAVVFLFPFCCLWDEIWTAKLPHVGVGQLPLC